MTSPKASNPRFRKIEGGRPYDPMTREAVGKTTKGHQLRVVALMKKDSFIDDAAAAVSSRASKMLFVMLLACFSILEWSWILLESASVVVTS